MRVITYNIRSFEGSGEAGSRCGEVVRRGQLIERMALELSLYDPDVLCLQEVQTLESVGELSRRLGMRFVHFEGGDKYGGWPLGIGGAVLTRYPVRESQSCPVEGGGDRPEGLFTRYWGRVRLDAPEGPCAVHAAHLHHLDHECRLREIEQVLRVVRRDMADGLSVLVHGDLNHEPDTAEYAAWAAAGLKDVFGSPGVEGLMTWPTGGPRQRIDYIWVGGPLARLAVQPRVLFEGAFRRNPADPGSFGLSDHVPVLAAFSPEMGFLADRPR